MAVVPPVEVEVRRIAFSAYERPVAQGSMIPFVRKNGTPGLRPSDNGLALWRSTIAQGAKAALGRELPFAGPVEVEIIFYLEDRRGPPGGPAFERWRSNRDLDKLVRAVLDAITMAAAWEDDAQVVRVTASKQWTSVARRAPGADVSISEYNIL